MFQESKDLPVTTPTRVGIYHELAAAIRRGCKMRPRQVFGVSIVDRDGACALGAAWVAGYSLDYIPDRLRDRIVRCNDQAKQTREFIADWIDRL